MIPKPRGLQKPENRKTEQTEPARERPAGKRPPAPTAARRAPLAARSGAARPSDEMGPVRTAAAPRSRHQRDGSAGSASRGPSRAAPPPTGRPAGDRARRRVVGRRRYDDRGAQHGRGQGLAGGRTARRPGRNGPMSRRTERHSAPPRPVAAARRAGPPGRGALPPNAARVRSSGTTRSGRGGDDRQGHGARERPVQRYVGKSRLPVRVPAAADGARADRRDAPTRA